MRPIVLIIAISLFSISLHAQFKKGDMELSLMATIDKKTVRIEYSTYNGIESEENTVIFFSISPAYYIIDNLAVEPEISASSKDNSKTIIGIIANLCYTYHPEKSIGALFVRTGYGLANGLYQPVVRGVVYDKSDKFDINTLTAGCGMKFLISSSAYIKTEINYRYQWSEEEKNISSLKYTVSFSSEDICLQIGLGIMF